MRSALLVLCIWALAAATAGAQAAPADGQMYVIGRPATGMMFHLPMDPADSIGSIYKCEKRVHKRNHGRGRGACLIFPQSIRAGRHMTLERKYRDVDLFVMGTNIAGPGGR